jgi:hypothetical protein
VLRRLVCALPLLLLHPCAVSAKDATAPALLLLGIWGRPYNLPPGTSGWYHTLVISSDQSRPVYTLMGLLVPRAAGFLRVDTRKGFLRASPLSARPSEYGSAAPDPCCFLDREILFVDRRYLSLRHSYECACPGERTASATYLRTLSLDALSAENEEMGLPMGDVLGPAVAHAAERAMAARCDARCCGGDVDRSWAISRVPIEEMNGGEGERSRWRVIARPSEYSCAGSGEFDIPEVPDVVGTLGLGGPSPEAKAIIQAASFRGEPAVVDVVLSPSEQLAAVVGDFEIALVRKVESALERTWQVLVRQAHLAETGAPHSACT